MLKFNILDDVESDVTLYTWLARLSVKQTAVEPCNIGSTHCEPSDNLIRFRWLHELATALECAALIRTPAAQTRGSQCTAQSSIAEPTHPAISERPAIVPT